MTHHIMHLNDDNFQNMVLDDAGLILVEIKADWSGTCHIMAPILEKLAHYYREQMKFGVLDVDASERVAREFGLDKLPILLFFRNGKIIDHTVGTVSKKDLEERIKAMIGPDVRNSAPEKTKLEL